MPRVSVIVPSYNTGAYLQQALDSVLSQTYGDWEVILVDDGSTDNTAAIAAANVDSFGDKLVYVFQNNRGLPAARNTAIRHARGEFISLLDADDVYAPRRLENSVAAMDRNPKAGLVHSRVARIGMQGENLGEPPVPSANYLSGNIADFIYTRRAHILCPTVMFRKSCLEEAGWFDENMKATEDRDLWFRIARNYSITYLDEVLAYYRISPTSMSKDWERMRKSALHFIEKHHHSGACGRLLMNQALGNFYRERGDAVFNTGDLKQALALYMKAVAYYPFNLANDYMLLRALGEPVLSMVRSHPS